MALLLYESRCKCKGRKGINKIKGKQKEALFFTLSVFYCAARLRNRELSSPSRESKKKRRDMRMERKGKGRSAGRRLCAAHRILSALEKWMPLYCGFREKAYTRTTDQHVHTRAYTSYPQAGKDKKERRDFGKFFLLNCC